MGHGYPGTSSSTIPHDWQFLSHADSELFSYLSNICMIKRMAVREATSSQTCARITTAAAGSDILLQTELRFSPMIVRSTTKRYGASPEACSKCCAANLLSGLCVLRSRSRSLQIWPLDWNRVPHGRNNFWLKRFGQETLYEICYIVFKLEVHNNPMVGPSGLVMTMALLLQLELKFPIWALFGWQCPILMLHWC